MTHERVDGPTPKRGDYTLVRYVDLATMNEVDKDRASGIVLTEHTVDDLFVMETVGPLAPRTRRRPAY